MISNLAVMLTAHVLLERRGETILESFRSFDNFGESLNLYLDVLEEFETVKDHHAGFRGFFRNRLANADEESLLNCVRTLREIADHTPVILQARIGSLVENEKAVLYENSLMCYVHKLRRETEAYMREFGTKVPYDI